jgi:hypothetical protein
MSAPHWILPAVRSPHDPGRPTPGLFVGHMHPALLCHAGEIAPGVPVPHCVTPGPWVWAAGGHADSLVPQENPLAGVRFCRDGPATALCLRLPDVPEVLVSPAVSRYGTRRAPALRSRSLFSYASPHSPGRRAFSPRLHFLLPSGVQNPRCLAARCGGAHRPC